jgi:hypothetical protein
MGKVQKRAAILLQDEEVEAILRILRNPKVVKSLDGQQRRRLTELITRLQTLREQAANSKVQVDDNTLSQILRFLSGMPALCKLLAAFLIDSGQ